LTADARRRQLVAIGLRLLVSRPIHDLPLDVVAAEAGISRGLLFHYFPTKRDYYAAVIEAAAQRLLNAIEAADVAVGAGASTQERVTAMVDRFATFIARRRAPYVALVRGAAGGDDLVNAIHEQTRAALVLHATELLPPPVNPGEQTLWQVTIAGWLAFVEDVLLGWSAEQFVPRAVIVGFLVDALDALLRLPIAPGEPTAAPGLALPAEGAAAGL
jgi:AcrR family transcriptional regulator